MTTVYLWLISPVMSAAQNRAVRYTIVVLMLLAVLGITLALALGTGSGAHHGPLAGGTAWA